jgi:hypothetical protein
MFRRAAALVLASCVSLCAAAAPALAQPIPPGSYQQSCTHIHVRGGILTARCSATNGQRIRSSIRAYCRGDIGNVNGVLQCIHHRRY